MVVWQFVYGRFLGGCYVCSIYEVLRDDGGIGEYGEDEGRRA